MCSLEWLKHISIHALREESDVVNGDVANGLPCISIHALREESDAAINGDWSGVWISIHALREESDFNVETDPKTWLYFNPRSP